MGVWCMYMCACVCEWEGGVHVCEWEGGRRTLEVNLTTDVSSQLHIQVQAAAHLLHMIHVYIPSRQGCK